MRFNIQDAIEISIPVVGGILGFAGAVYSLRGESDKGRAMLAGWAVVTSIVSVMNTYNTVVERRLEVVRRQQANQLTQENVNASV